MRIWDAHCQRVCVVGRPQDFGFTCNDIEGSYICCCSKGIERRGGLEIAGF